MANPINYKDLFDIDGLQEALKRLESENSKLSKSIDDDIKRNVLSFTELRKAIELNEAALRSANAINKEGQQTIIRITKEVHDQTEEYKKLNETIKGQGAAQQFAADSVNGLKKKVSELTQEYYALSKSSDPEKMKQLAEEIRKTKQETNDLTNATKRVNTEFTAAKGSYNAIVQENKRLSEELRNLPDGFDLTSKRANELKNKIAENTVKLKDFDQAMGQSYRNVGNYAESIIRAKRELDKQKSSLNEQVAALKAQLIATRGNAEFQDKLQRELAETNAKLKDVNSQLRQYGNSSNQIGNITKGVSAGIKNFALQMGAAYLSIQAIGSALRYGLDKLKAFEMAIDNLGAITGASEEDLRFYEDAAKDIGKTTTTSALQAVEAFKLIGSAKPELLKNKEALVEVTKSAITLAEASGLELPEAAKRLTDAMNQFNLPAEAAAKTIDVLAAGAKAGAAEVPAVTEALVQFGTGANAANVSLQESVGLIELFAEKGQQGADVGTKIRNVLLTLSTAKGLPKEAAEQLEKFGVNTDILTDKTLPLNVRLKELSKISGDATALVKVFGKENFNAGQIILNNLDKLDQYTEGVDENGVAMDQAKQNTDNLQGSMTRFTNKIESLTLSFNGNGGLTKALRFVIDGLGDFIDMLTIANQSVEDIQKKSNDALKSDVAKDYVDDYEAQVKRLTDKGFELADAQGRALKSLFPNQDELAMKIKKNKDQIAELGKVYEETKRTTLQKVSDPLDLIGFGDKSEEAKKKQQDLRRETSLLEGQMKAYLDITKKSTVAKTDEVKATEALSEADKKSGDEVRKTAEEKRKATYELSKFRIEQEIKTLEKISSTESNMLEERLTAEVNISKRKLDLSLLEKDFLLQEEGLFQDEITLINEKASAKNQEIEQNKWDHIKKIQEDALNDLKKNTLAILESSFSEEGNFYQENYNDQLNTLRDFYAKGNLTKEEFDLKKEKLDLGFKKDEIQREIDLTEQKFNVNDLTNDELIDLEKKLIALKQSLRDADFEALEKDKDRELDLLKKKKDEEKEIIQAGIDFALEGISAVFDMRANKLQAEMDALQASKERELELAGDNEAAKEKIEQQYARREAALKKEMAKKEKQRTLFEIAINTGLNIVKVFPNPVLMALAAATGIIQAAVVASQKIPEFWKGTENAPEGMAWIGERGRELVESRGTYYLSGPTKELRHLKAGDKVYTAERTKSILKNVEKLSDSQMPDNVLESYNKSITAMSKYSQPSVTLENIEQIVKIAQQRDSEKIVEAINNKKEFHFNWGVDGPEMWVKQHDNWSNYKNKRYKSF